jgi:tetratricopeptide (TPR) repeat protein
VGTDFYQASLDEAERLVRANPDNPDAYFKKAIYLEALGRTSESLTAVKQAINLDPDPDYLMKEAELLEIAGDYQTALARASRAQILGGDYPELWHLMASLNYRQGNLETALSEVNQALQKYPESLSYYCTKGKIYWSLNDTLMAIDCFSKSSSNPETQYESLKYLALINRITGNYEQAFEYVNQNLDAYPDDRDLLLEKGKLFSETSQYDSALTIFHQLIAKDTADLEPLYQSALVHYQRRWYDSALYYTGKTLQLDDRHFPSMLTEARVYDRRTYYGTSMRKYQEILDIDSTYTPAVEELTYLRGKVAYLQKIRAEREANSQVEIISPTKPPN